LATKADKRCRQDTLAAERRRRESAEHAAATAESALDEEQHCRKLAERAALMTELALAKEQCRKELAEHAAATAESALAEEQHCRELVERNAALVESALAKKQRLQESADCAVVSAESTLTNECHRREAAECATALAELVLAKERRRRETAECAAMLAEPALVAVQHRHESAERAKALAPTALRIEAYAAPFFACIDAVMAKIRAMDDGFGNWAAFSDELLAEENDDASALTMPPLAPPTAVSSPPHRPTSYVDAVLSTMGGSTRVTSLALAPSAIPSPIVNGQLRTVCRRTRPRHCTGRRHRPRAPSPPDKVLPSHPHPTKEGLSTPTNPPNLLARAATRSGTPSLAPPLTASSNPSLLPFTFGSEVCLSLEGVVAHPFCVGNPPPQKCTQHKNPTLLYSPTSWPLGSQSTGAPSLWAASSAPHSQPIKCEWMGLSRGGGFCCFLFFWRHLGDVVASYSFGGTWGILLLPGSFGSTFRETIFLVKGNLLFVFLSFGSYWLIVTWCIVLFLHPLPSVLLGLFVHLPFSFPLHDYAMNCGGMLVSSSPGGAKNYRYQQYFVPLEINKVLFHSGTISVLLHQ
jgi:hypothetical protein